MKLLMIKIGARPKGRLIEQHDIAFFGVTDFTQVIALINATWGEVKNNWHIDAWREVNRVGDYRIELVEKSEIPSPTQTVDLAPLPQDNQLYFINLGGYLPNVFEEFHHKELVVAPQLSAAVAKVKQSDFYKHYDLASIDPLTGINGVSHVDDKMLVDDIHCVNELLPNVTVKITPLTQAQQHQFPHDDLHIGYLSRKKIKNFLA